MAVTLKANWNRADVEKLVRQQLERMDRAVLMALQRAGEGFIADARSVNTYQNQTGNLRSSIGYIILKNGEPVYSAFPGDKQEGKNQGREAVAEIAQSHARGYVLIVVAGMDYAAAVESKGYDVLTGSAPAAEAMLKKAIERIKSKATL